MSRYYKPTTREELQEHIRKVATESNKGRRVHYPVEEFRAVFDYVRKDIKVKFDLENVSWESSEKDFGPDQLIGYIDLGNGLVVRGCCAGGDWECPVYFVLYYDGKRLRAYVPTDGNLWNTDTKQAYGNGEDAAEWRNVRKRWPDMAHTTFEAQERHMEASEWVDFDPEALRNDIRSRLKPLEDRTDRTTAEGTSLLGSHFTNQELLLGALIASYDMDAPHVSSPGLYVGSEDKQHYPDINEEKFLSWLEGEHHGDCTNVCCPCIRCHAEAALHQARWLLKRVNLTRKKS